MLIGFYHGLRISEILSLTPRNFAFGKLTIGRGKGSRDTTQTLVTHSNPLLDESAQIAGVLGTLGPSTRLFPWTRQHAWRIFKTACFKARLTEHGHPHLLKHSCGMAMIQSGATLPETQAGLGHKSITSTAVYLHASDKSADVAALKAFV